MVGDQLGAMNMLIQKTGKMIKAMFPAFAWGQHGRKAISKDWGTCGI